MKSASSSLIDGMWQGTWQIRDKTLRIQPFTKLPRADHDALLTEAAHLCAFIPPQPTYDLAIDRP